MNSPTLSLNLPDWLKGLVMAVISAVLVTVQQTLATGGISTIDWQVVGGIALTTGVSYLIKNFFSDTNGKVAGIPGTGDQPKPIVG